MSNVYHTEPPTLGKVLLKTNYGDVDIELWPKEAPLACRNFVQLCLEGYYDGTSVHRIIKQFMIQMGDPTGTGKGGESIWGRPFKDEVHGRIKFNHRGQVAMANENAPHTNHSQFFITLGACEWLNKKHTIFGKVTGNTIFNVLRIGEVDTNEQDRPLEPITILQTEVLLNPFDDIIPRDLSKQQKAKDNAPKVPAASAVAEKVKPTVNKKLLSFGDDEEEGDTVVVKKDRSVMGSMSQQQTVPQQQQIQAPSAVISISTSSSNGNSSNSQSRRKVDQTDGDNLYPLPSNINATRDTSSNVIMHAEEMEAALASMGDGSSHKEQLLLEKKKEFDQLKQDLLKSKRAVKSLTGPEAEKIRNEAIEKDLLSPLEQMRQKYAKRKRSASGNREEETLAKLSSFTAVLRQGKQELQQPPCEGIADDAASRKTQFRNGKISAVTYHGQVLEPDSDEDDVNAIQKDWFAGKL